MDDDVTKRLRAWSEGEPGALDELMPCIMQELQVLARAYFRAERPNHTLQPTALIGELSIRLVGTEGTSWENRHQFFAFAAKLMRQILVDHARARAAQRRGGDVLRYTLTESNEPPGVAGVPVEALLDLDSALTALGERDAALRELVELRYFGGLTISEAATALGISASKVKRDWAIARRFLAREMADPLPDGV